MADAGLAGEMSQTSSLIEQLGKALVELEVQKDAADDKGILKDIIEHFRDLESSMMKKYSEIENKEKKFKEEESDTQALLEERELAVASREQEMFDRIQELKDVAVVAITEARATHLPESVEPIDVENGKESKVSSSLGDKNAPLIDPKESSPYKTDENDEVADEVKPRPELIQYCEQMDGRGLLNFIMENPIDLVALSEELSLALENATEPGQMVLGCLEGFYPPDDTTQDGNSKQNVAAFEGMRQSCVKVLEALATLWAKADLGADHLLNHPEFKQQAKAIADEWKPNLADAGINSDATNKNSLEAQAFLQLLATFRIASEFDEEELCKLLLAVAEQSQAPELCRSLGLTHKVPGIVEALINKKKQIHAVHFVHAFELTESFPSVPLLQIYLKELRRSSQGKGSNSGNSDGGANDANAQELAALRDVIQCVKRYKLEEEYPLDPLLRRVSQLENSRPEKKRFGGDSGKQRQKNKKMRANGGGGSHSSHRSTGGRPPIAAAGGGRRGPPIHAARTMQAGIPERYSHPTMNSAYNYQTPPPSQTSAYTHQQGYDERSYYYPPEERVAAAPPTYASYANTGYQPYM